MGRLTRKAHLLYFSLIFPLFLFACAPRRPAQPLPRTDGIYHTVMRGENLFRIGKAYDIPYRELAEINRLEDPNQLRAGQKVFIPGATRQLPVEIITPSTASLKPPSPADSRERSREGLIWPVTGSITSEFGPRGATFHDGIDISAPEGSPIRAVDSGEVMYTDQIRGYGNIIIIRHGGGIVSVYAHNRRNDVAENQKVAQGETIAEVGSTGRVTAPHLHFEVRRDNVAENPLNYLPQ